MTTVVHHKQIAIIGGTGTLGQQLIEAMNETWPGVTITVLSRDEHKQATLKRKYPKVIFKIADVKKYDSIAPHMIGKDLVFHVAAMKHVDICEENTLEAIDTNIIGTSNVARACVAAKVPFCVYSSTDKSVDPINTYGYTKALGEKLLYDLNRNQKLTRFSVYRWGNILGSSGSVVPQFIKTLREEKKAYVTDMNMTRFWLPIEWPVTYMMRTYAEAKLDQAMIPPVMKSASVVEVIDSLASILSIQDYSIEITGLRAGEKIHEAMRSQHDGKPFDSFHHERYTTGELRDLLLPFVGASA